MPVTKWNTQRDPPLRPPKKTQEAVFRENWWTVKSLQRKEEYYAELQRATRYLEKREDVIEAIAIYEVFASLMELGKKEWKKYLETETARKDFVEGFSRPPDYEAKGRFPYLKNSVIQGVFDRVEKIRNDLKQKYEEKYGNIKKENINA